MAVPAFPYLRILPGRGEGRYAGRAADQRIGCHEDKRSYRYVRFGLGEGESGIMAAFLCADGMVALP
jgi:hypothetical protein